MDIVRQCYPWRQKGATQMRVRGQRTRQPIVTCGRDSTTGTEPDAGLELTDREIVT